MDCVFFQGLRFTLIKKDQGLGFRLEFEISRQRRNLLKKERKRKRKENSRKKVGDIERSLP